MTYKMTSRNGKTDREHRFIAEAILGRKLRPDEVVHHIDGNKRNNSIENLMVVTRVEHARIHQINLDKSKAVVQMNKNGEVIKIWESARKAFKNTGVYPGNISKCCHGKLKSTGGYTWKFAE